ncbi:MAG TPA: fibronectin/fibrinogen-binding protein [Firmicutes bacterium]|nr:fibronectin/fibrinogen-binding protein [Bacillota bacterium]
MTADTLTLSAITAELRALAGSRIDRIYQISRYEVLLYLYQTGTKCCLLLSAHPQRSRAHLTRQTYQHPEQPAAFCMLLRKYLVGGVIQDIYQPPVERIVKITVRSLEGIFTVDLVAELMGRRSNLILINKDRQILGALRNSTVEQNRCRDILPGKTYLPPPVPDKFNPLMLDAEKLSEALVQLSKKGKSPQTALLMLVQGISPLAATELVYRSSWANELLEHSARRLAEELQIMFQNSREGRFTPCWALTENKYAPYRLTHLSSPQTGYRSMNELLDDYYTRNIEQEYTGGLRRSLQAAARRKLSKAERKLSEQHHDLKRAEDKDQLRLYGETLLAFSHQVPPKAEQVELPDPYRTGQAIQIPLDPRLSASGNAQRYFKQYQKAKQIVQKSREQLRLTRNEIRYYQQVVTTIEQADRHLLLAIRQELAGEKLPRKPSVAEKRMAALPLSFRSSVGNTILVGRNQRQNDLLTFKLSSRQDTWLHARGLTGSHVLIKDTSFPPPQELLEEAALLAAYYSKGRDSTSVEVDYTTVKFVRRSPGGKLGQVLYTNYKTVTVRPSSERLHRLLAQV